jgi:hypothetical protein
MGFASKGGAAMEKGVYTEVSTPYTPVGAFTRRAVQRPAEASPKVTTVAGGTAQPAAVQSTPLTPQRVQGGGATPAPKRLTR